MKARRLPVDISVRRSSRQFEIATVMSCSVYTKFSSEDRLTMWSEHRSNANNATFKHRGRRIMVVLFHKVLSAGGQNLQERMRVDQ
jgi:hypothetical protein